MTSKRNRTLMEELEAHRGRTVYIGARSSYFFIGPCEEAMDDIGLLGMMSRLCVALTTRSKASIRSARPCDMASRVVKKTYPRVPGHEREGDVVIIVEGREYGAFWTRREYLAGRELLLAALNEDL